MKRTGFQGRGLWLLVLLGCLVVVGCKGGTPGFTPRQNRPPVIRQLEIRPANPEAGSDVGAFVRYIDPDQDQVMLEYRWLVDGKVVQEGGKESLPGSELAAGSEIGLMVRARDAEHIGDWVPAKPVKVEAPEVKILGVWIEPTEPTKSSTLEAKVDAGDEDASSLDLYYRWRVNGQVVEDASEPTLDGEYFNPGDQVTVEVSPDSEFASRAILRSGFVKIANQPPQITSEMSFTWDGQRYQYQVEAEDPDDDPLTYALDRGPAGMTIDSKSGLLSWSPKPAQAGSHEVQVSVSDGRGGKNGQIGEINLEVQETKPRR